MIGGGGLGMLAACCGSDDLTGLRPRDQSLGGAARLRLRRRRRGGRRLCRAGGWASTGHSGICQLIEARAEICAACRPAGQACRVRSGFDATLHETEEPR